MHTFLLHQKMGHILKVDLVSAKITWFVTTIDVREVLKMAQQVFYVVDNKMFDNNSCMVPTHLGKQNSVLFLCNFSVAKVQNSPYPSVDSMFDFFLFFQILA